ncbi:Global nitrogen regulator [Roseibaca ekhonensis]|jgi:CRP/FNR family transcriptional regulator|uniref:Global nitrogen regulator n=1 Tax=Roseinatronobacter ekhonensis TaxID=254356 RepID=A0A3B0M9V4_9RHOB|nr:Crp/Fnr family transcriptional regulator [Roseibaca ekhonensis]SUZ32453.1 Global nitrogen regulator [Roseibaca ekhonensis]
MAWAGALLPGLDADIAARLDALPCMEVPTGRSLFRAGDSAQGFAMVLDGRVEVTLTAASGREILLYAIEPGQSCIQTTLALMGDVAYTGDATTVTPARIVMIPAAEFARLMDGSAIFRAFVFRAFAARMAELTSLLETVAFTRIEARLARALLDLATDAQVHATHAELAARIGSAREVVSRQLERWATQKLIATQRGQITILDRAGLARIA